MARASLGSPVKSTESFTCVRCGKKYPAQHRNFPKAQSKLYDGNLHFLPYCAKCVDELFEYYRVKGGMSERDAMKRLCSKLDIYWSQAIFKKLPPSDTSTKPLWRLYLSEASKLPYQAKTYDDTLDEEAAALARRVEGDDGDAPEPTRDMIRFWGKGRSSESYFELQDSYDTLAADYTLDTPASKMLLKQVCLSEYEINQLQLEGKSFEKQQASLVNTLGSLNLKPSQIKEQEANSGLDNMTIGIGIQHWEQTRPVPEPDPSWRDVDGIIKYVVTWFLGTICNMFGLDNKYSRQFHAELDRLRVERPDFEDTGDEEIVENILEDGGGS